MNTTQSINKIQDALRFIPVGGHDERVRIAFALKSACGEPGRALWDEWRNGRGDDEADSVWKSAKADGLVTAGTLFHLAKQHGWKESGTRQQAITANLDKNSGVQPGRESTAGPDVQRESLSTADRARLILEASSPARSDHPYLQIKSVLPTTTLYEIDVERIAELIGYTPKSRGEPLIGRVLVVPVKQKGRISTLELIDGSKRKSALPGHGTKSGGYWATARMPSTDEKNLTILIGEGVATCLSANQSTGHLAIAALSSSNLMSVAKEIRDIYPSAVIIVLADLIKETGETDEHAVAAARAVNGKLAVPAFEGKHTPAHTDFNDMVAARGCDAVARVINSAADVPGKFDANAWNTPEPFGLETAALQYPIDALPPLIRNAVMEVVAFTQAPIALVASSALAAISVACQAYANVKRAEGLEGPIGLYLLVLADSGERKSTCDAYFTSAIRQHEEALAEVMKPELKKHEAALAAWQAEHDGLTSEIKRKAKRRQSTDILKEDLAQLQNEQPAAPRVPRILLGDETSENLAWSLAKQWPSAAVLSSEAGVVLGSHAMSGDNITRNLSLQNVLWDGGSHSIGRRTSESFTVRGARLTLCLMVQEPTLREYLNRAGELPRGIGYFARFLIAAPESTQGTRFFVDPPTKWPYLTKFNEHIASLLSQPVPMDENGALKPRALPFSPEAKDIWKDYYNEIEYQLRPGGEYFDVRDVASKAADNAARLAALFHLASGQGAAISVDAMQSACQVSAWHLHEALRFFGVVALPKELADAIRLDDWLVKYCRREKIQALSTRDAQRRGPFRDRARLDQALRTLEDLNRVRFRNHGKQRLIDVNPALLAVTP